MRLSFSLVAARPSPIIPTIARRRSTDLVQDLDIGSGKEVVHGAWHVPVFAQKLVRHGLRLGQNPVKSPYFPLPFFSLRDTGMGRLIAAAVEIHQCIT
jgi:hypothetical protein